MHDDPVESEQRNLRNRVREIVRAEVDRHGPLDEARTALELIVETSLHYSEADGVLRITVVDEDGRPRTMQKDGPIRDFMIDDLMDELRAKHPALFKAARIRNADIRTIPDRTAQPDRDWLNLGSLMPPSDQPKQHRPFAVDSAPELPRRHYRRWSMVSGAGAIAVLIALGILALPGRGHRESADRSKAVASAVEDPTTTGALAGPQAPPPETTSAATAASPADNGILRGVPEAVDTATLRIQGKIVRLFGVEWASGAGKPEDLNAYLQGREVTCEPTGLADTYRCQVGGQDLSKVVLFNGGGRTTAQATDDLKAAEEKARSAGIGVWSR